MPIVGAAAYSPLKTAIEKAKTAGAAWVGVTRSNHAGPEPNPNRLRIETRFSECSGAEPCGLRDLFIRRNR